MYDLNHFTKKAVMLGYNSIYSLISGIRLIMGSRRTCNKNCTRMAINTLLQRLSMEKGIGFVDMWASIV